MDKNKFKEQTYKDFQGNIRWKDSKKLVHRGIAYRKIYLKNRKKYSLPFKKYQVHHKNKNKNDNRVENLELKTIYEHEYEHKVERAEWILIRILVVIIFILGLLLWLDVIIRKFELNKKVGIVSFIIILFLGCLTILYVNRKKKGVKYV